jgi:hypothetical protein
MSCNGQNWKSRRAKLQKANINRRQFFVTWVFVLRCFFLIFGGNDMQYDLYLNVCRNNEEQWMFFVLNTAMLR